ncbi:MAG: hypothetical protein FJ267_17210, partial [Planctomycetes bacterium]|nr:hypothetical protein [Planctomycetota bacterium]
MMNQPMKKNNRLVGWALLPVSALKNCFETTSRSLLLTRPSRGIGVDTNLRTRIRRSFFSLRLSNLCGVKPFPKIYTAEIGKAQRRRDWRSFKVYRYQCPGGVGGKYRVHASFAHRHQQSYPHPSPSLPIEVSKMKTRCGMVFSNQILVALFVMLSFLFGMVSVGSAQSTNLVKELETARRVVVPIDDLDVVVERDKRGVMLSKTKFDELLEMAKANAEKVPPSQIPILLNSSQYQARLAGDQLLINLTAEVTQFSADWQSLSLPLQRLAVEKVTLDDQPATIGRLADGNVLLLCDKPGQHTLQMELSTDITSLGSDQVAAFSLFKAPSGYLTITLPAGKRLVLGSV